MLAELSRREKTANIMPDPDIDIFMKVRKKLLPVTYSLLQQMIDSHLFWSRDLAFMVIDNFMWFYYCFFYFKGALTKGQEASIMTDYLLKVTLAWSVEVAQQLFTMDHLFQSTSLQVLGLELCADSMVGDQMLRVISRGQRKCVTTGKLNYKHQIT